MHDRSHQSVKSMAIPILRSTIDQCSAPVHISARAPVGPLQGHVAINMEVHCQHQDGAIGTIRSPYHGKHTIDFEAATFRAFQS